MVKQVANNLNFIVIVEELLCAVASVQFLTFLNTNSFILLVRSNFRHRIWHHEFNCFG